MSIVSLNSVRVLCILLLVNSLVLCVSVIVAVFCSSAIQLPYHVLLLLGNSCLGAWLITYCQSKGKLKRDVLYLSIGVFVIALVCCVVSIVLWVVALNEDQKGDADTDPEWCFRDCQPSNTDTLLAAVVADVCCLLLVLVLAVLLTLALLSAIIIAIQAKCCDESEPLTSVSVNQKNVSAGLSLAFAQTNHDAWSRVTFTEQSKMQCTVPVYPPPEQLKLPSNPNTVPLDDYLPSDGELDKSQHLVPQPSEPLPIVCMSTPRHTTTTLIM